MIQKLRYTTEPVDQYVIDTYNYFQQRLKYYCPNDYQSFIVRHWCNFRPYLFTLTNWDKQVEMQVKYKNQYVSDWSKFYFTQHFICTDKYTLYIVDKFNDVVAREKSIDYDPENIVTHDKLVKIFDLCNKVL